MMKKFILPPLVYIALLVAVSDSFAESIPRFTWPAFQRFWNARCMPGAALHDGRIVPHGREIVFGNTLKLFIWIEKDQIKGARIRYFDPGGENEFALLFVKMIQSSIAAGTFRWPPDKTLEARQLFYEMNESPIEYQYMVTLFKRSFNLNSGWEFSFIYAQPTDDVSAFVWPDEVKK